MDEVGEKVRPPRKAYKIRGPETWALIRESYLAGAPAKVLAERYDVTTWAIWRRAWREKWTKQDRVEPTPPPPLGPLAGDLSEAACEPGDLARAALRGVARAMGQNRLDEARELAGLADVLTRISSRAPQSSLEIVARAALDPVYVTEVLGIWGETDPDPVKVRYWKEVARRERAREAATRGERESVGVEGAGGQ